MVQLLREIVFHYPVLGGDRPSGDALVTAGSNDSVFRFDSGVETVFGSPPVRRPTFSWCVMILSSSPFRGGRVVFVLRMILSSRWLTLSSLLRRCPLCGRRRFAYPALVEGDSGLLEV